jgi:hypothetical protein
MLERQPKTEAECESVLSHAKEILTKRTFIVIYVSLEIRALFGSRAFYSSLVFYIAR